MCVHISFSCHCLSWYLICSVCYQGTDALLGIVSMGLVMCRLLLYRFTATFFSVFFILVKIFSYWQYRNSLGFGKSLFSALIFNDNLLINQFLTNTKTKNLGFLKFSEEKYQRPKWKYYLFLQSMPTQLV